MPNRILRDWTDSFTIDSLDASSERFFVRLIMKVDDYGRFYAEPRLLRANLFPLKPDIRETDISRWLAACEKAGLIALYNVANKEYLQINNFKQVLRQKKEKYPAPITCLADDKHTHSNSNAIASLKRNESESEIETEIEAFSPPSPNLSPSELMLPMPVEECGKVYFTSKEYSHAREQLAMNSSITAERLREWGRVFVKELIEGGTLTKSPADFAKHFRNWMKFRYLGENPSNYGLKLNVNDEKSAEQKRLEFERAVQKFSSRR